MMFSEAALEFKSKSNNLKIASASLKEKNIFAKTFKFEDMGVGGLDKEIITMFRRAFATRRLPPSVLHKFGNTHVKGVLLYGPPGTGKTLIARELCKCLHSVPPIVVNGPDILSKFVGESEENVRKLFAAAKKDQQEQGDDSPLHVIIFDEFDSIGKPRGMDSDSTGVASNVVNQLLAMIDGVDSLNNILLIAMTNRKDLIDPAILRPGRFEVHIEVNLPDENGRLQILKIHTKDMRQNEILGKSVDLEEIARRTKNFTGAELASLTRSAATLALDRQHKLMDFSKELHFTKDNMMVEMEDFVKALDDVTPDFGFDEDKISSNLRGDIISYGESFDYLMGNLREHISGFKCSDIPIASLLLYGVGGSGKTTLACKLAKFSEIAYTKFLSSESLIGLSEFGKIKVIQGIFNNAYRSPISLIIIDEIERLLEYVHVGSRFNNNILQCLLTYLKKLPEKIGHKIIVIGTTSRKEVVDELGIWDCFNLKIKVPVLLGSKPILMALQQMLPGVDLSSISIDKGHSIPIKNLYFIANVIKQKLADNPRADVEKVFLDVISQTEVK